MASINSIVKACGKCNRSLVDSAFIPLCLDCAKSNPRTGWIWIAFVSACVLSFIAGLRFYEVWF